jgi:hypothetical protein
LLQFARGGQHVLNVVLGIEHHPLRLGRDGGCERQQRRAGGERLAETMTVHSEISWLGGGGEHVGRPIQALAAQPCGGETVAAMRGHGLRDGRLIGLGRGGSESEGDLGEP